MKQDRFLMGILIGIGLLVVAALVVFFTRRTEPSYSGQNTPDGVVHDYVLAILNKDYPKAYTYLANLDHKPTLAEFRQGFAVGKMNPGEGGIQIGPSSITGDEATVEVSLVYGASDPFSSGYSNIGTAQLVRQNGTWKISSMPTYNIWDYSWYQPGPK